jgi:hypothetical protein
MRIRKIVRALDWFLGHRIVKNEKLASYLKRQKPQPNQDRELFGKDNEGHSWPHNEQKPYPY